MLISESLVRDLFQQAPFPCLILRADSLVIESANPAFIDTVSAIQPGSSFETLTGDSETHPTLICDLKQSEASGKAVVIRQVNLFTSATASSLVFDISSIPFENEEGSKRFLLQFNDISGHIRAKWDADTRDANFRKMIMDAPVAMAVLAGEKLIIESANTAILELWDRSAEVIGMDLHTALPELESQPFFDILANVRNSGEAFYGYEFLARLARNGILQDCYFNFVYSPVRESIGNTAKVMVIAYEVTQQVESKRKVEISEKRFRNLVAESLVPTAIYMGEHMRIVLANDAMLSLWHKDPTVIGKNLEEALPELDGQPFMRLLKNVYHTGITYRGKEDRADILVDGSLQTFFFNFTYKALRDINGEIYAILNMAIDITEQVRAKQAIIESQDRLSQAIQAADLGTYEYDFENRKMHYSRRMAEIFGFDGQPDLELSDFLKIIHPEDMYIRNAAHDLSVTSGELRYEVRLLLPGNSLRWIRLNGDVKFDEHGNRRNLYGTVMDITAEKTEQQTLRSSEEKLRRLAAELEIRVQERTRDLKEANADLVRSNQELEQFAFVTSHDLQEPLRKVRTFANLLKDRNGHLLDERGINYLGKITASSARMSELISSLLNFSRLMNNEDRMVDVDLNEVLQNVISDFELLIIQKSALIEYDQLPVIKANPLQMNQLLYNLLINALKFTKAGQAASIRVTHRELDGEVAGAEYGLSQNGTYCHIQMIDNGIGFEQQYASKIFDIFQRLNDRTLYEGTGIGLALCKKIVSNHGGTIYAEGKPGIGAQFHVILPIG
ncbi:MAG TPA: ATP-binding protein [Flavitalea sp.]|nr:ATP-binding protein [Flavitalea sp.]